MRLWRKRAELLFWFSQTPSMWLKESDLVPGYIFVAVVMCMIQNSKDDCECQSVTWSSSSPLLQSPLPLDLPMNLWGSTRLEETPGSLHAILAIVRVCCWFWPWPPASYYLSRPLIPVASSSRYQSLLPAWTTLPFCFSSESTRLLPFLLYRVFCLKNCSFHWGDLSSLTQTWYLVHLLGFWGHPRTLQ